MNENNSLPNMENETITAVKKSYDEPELRLYGKIQDLTRNITASSGEGASGMGMAP